MNNTDRKPKVFRGTLREALIGYSKERCTRDSRYRQDVAHMFQERRKNSQPKPEAKP